MNNINELLKFRFSYALFSEKGRNVIPAHLENINQSRISTLNSITEKHENFLNELTPINGIRETYLKFIKISQLNKDFSGKFDKRELRTLTFALEHKKDLEISIFESSIYLEQCLMILNDNWKDTFISGLFACYLSNWASENKKSFTILGNFITDKISNYSGSRNLFRSLKKNFKYFNKGNGPLVLGHELAILNISISKVTKFLSLPDDWILYPYFSEVINSFFEKSKDQLENILDDIVFSLEKHSNYTKATKINKLVVSKIICHTRIANESIQNKVKDIAFKLVGDPAIHTIWRPFEFDEINQQPEIKIINKAREILNEWVTRQFINVFFEECINDDRRKCFWLKCSKEIRAFKVFGPNRIKRVLKADKRIREFVDSRYHIVSSSRDVSAFMFLIGEHKMIEFSEPGYAFYAYKESNSMAPSFDEKNIASVDNFTDGSMPMLVYRSGYKLHSYSEEGRLSHSDGDMKWEDVFSHWLEKKAGINV